MPLRLCTDHGHPVDPGPDIKLFKSLQARFAMKGWAFDPLHGDKLLLQRWGMTRVLQDLDEAERVLVQIGGAA